ncbi:acyl transferase/acyl hydrolase/lysophospholipase [Aspergillus pseudoustus]|uniref:Patatin-like phospholipase domain-containing protein n=1 Tax=Aspergillus pseudoustus TaxID=1810923 RepID=A0ABR4J943_9EURO
MSPPLDTSIISSTWHRMGKHSTNQSSYCEISLRPPRCLASVPSLASVVRGPITWAGNVWNPSSVGRSKQQKFEQDLQAEAEDRKQVLYLRLRDAVSYEEWKDCANELDYLENNNAWKETFECDEYNAPLVQERLGQLEAAHGSCDVSQMLYLIRTSLSRDLGGMSNASLYRHTHVGTKDLIDRYITAAVETIASLVEVSGGNRCDAAESRYILDQLLAARQAFGRSALLFSGGATFGMNHIGVLKSLWMNKLLPRIISGASAGSIVCAVFCTRTEDELPALLASFPYGDFSVFDAEDHEENILQKTARFLKHGAFLDITHLAKVMRSWLGDITFQEAYNRTRRILNICVSSAGVYELPKLLNYITAPNVLIWSAVAVSCSVPVVFSPFTLMAKDPLTGEPIPWNDLHKQYIDGSVDGDLPMNRLSEMFNVNHFIVSQVNPHIVPFLPKDDEPKGFAVPTSRFSRILQTVSQLAKDEMMHRMTVLTELGAFPNSFTKTISIMNQKYSGDINIYPEILYAHFPRILKNPTTDFMLKACLCGERATWPKLARIRNHCSIELALDTAIQKMRARVALSNTHAALLANTLNHHSITIDRSSDRGRRRRSSCSHEYEKRKGAGSRSSRPSLAKVGRSLSHSFESYHPGADQEADWLWVRPLGFDILKPEVNSRNEYGTEGPSLGSYPLEQGYFSPDPECSMDCSQVASTPSSSSLSPVRAANSLDPRPPTPAAIPTSPRRHSHPMRSISPPRFSLRMTPASPEASRPN